MASSESIIPEHGGYRNLKSFQVAQLVYDMTVRFCNRYIDKRSRTCDQMVQAARSGVQNIAEGSQASGTSKKTELKLTNVARASLEELRLDYEDFLRQQGLPMLPPNHPALMRFKKKRCATLQGIQGWVAEELERQNTDLHEQAQHRQRQHGQTHGQTWTVKDHPTLPRSVPVPDRPSSSVPVPDRPCSSVPVRDCPCQSSVPVRDRPCPSVPSSALAANAALSLLNLACYFLDRQLAAQAKAFENEGGFTERLYRVRSERRRSGPKSQ